MLALCASGRVVISGSIAQCDALERSHTGESGMKGCDIRPREAVLVMRLARLLEQPVALAKRVLTPPTRTCDRP